MTNRNLPAIVEQFFSQPNFLGFERMLDELVSTPAGSGTYPYDVVQTDEDSWAIHVALAGFSPEDVEVVAEANKLTVSGKSPLEKCENQQYIYKGIAKRDFRLVFRLGEHMEVGTPVMHQGMLSIPVKREIPEAMKPKKIEIVSTGDLEEAEQPKLRAAG